MSIARYLTGILTMLAVILVRLYRSVDNLLSGSPVWEQAAARRNSKDRVEGSARLLNGRVVTE
ncbi:hypothetical protein ACIP6V_09535 [Streptomyces sp. NPDC088770]|uniref:hypothetical protein n=1 Tax=Streptomyces sp. NPDC088770 TaxID=3365895 RepID=UPI003823E217